MPYPATLGAHGERPSAVYSWTDFPGFSEDVSKQWTQQTQDLCVLVHYVFFIFLAVTFTTIFMDLRHAAHPESDSRSPAHGAGWLSLTMFARRITADCWILADKTIPFLPKLDSQE